MGGSGFVLSFLAGTTILSNAMGLALHERRHPLDDRVAPLTSTSGGIVAMGVFCALRHGKWAAWPGIPVPTAWMLAPVLVADLSAISAYFGQLSEFEAIANVEGFTKPPADSRD